MSEPVFEAFARIRPHLDPSFRAEAVAQIQGATAGVIPVGGRSSGLRSVAAVFGELTSRTQAVRKEVDSLNGRIAAVDAQFGQFNAGMGSTIIRAAGVTLGLTALYQASRDLKSALDVTGAAAFTTEGRIRNLGASLVQGDIVGGIRAITSSATHFEDLGISVQEASRHVGDFTRISQTAGSSFGALGTEGVAAVRQISEEALEAVRQMRELDAATLSVMNATLGLRDARGRQIVGSPASFGVGFDRPAPIFPEYQNPPVAIGPRAKNAAAQTIAQARGDDDALLELRQAERVRAAKAIESRAYIHGNVRQREQMAKDLAAADVAVITTSKQIKANAEAAIAAANAAAESKRRQAEADAREALAAREVAARERVALIRTNMSNREGRLQNRLLVAQNTENIIKDDREQLNALIRFYREKEKDQRLEVSERQAYAAKRIQYQEELENLALPERTGGGELRRLQLANAESLAALTKRKTDDRKAINATISYWQGQARSLREAGKLIEAETAESAVIAARGRLAALANIKQATGGNGTTAFELLQGAASRFSGGNLINRDQPFAGPTGFTADLAQWLKRMTDALERNTGATNGNTASKERFPTQGARGTSDRAFWEARNARAAVEASG